MGGAAQAADIAVNDTGDDLHATGCAATGAGTCTLRDAITFANANPGVDNIYLGSGAVIRPVAALPQVLGAVNLMAAGVFTAAPAIIDGALAGPTDGLTLPSDSKLLGLVVRRFEGSGIVLLGGGNQIGASPICIPLCPLSPLPVSVSENGAHGIQIRGGGNWLRFVSAFGNAGNGIDLPSGSNGTLIGEFESPLSGAVAFNRLAGIRIGDNPNDSLSLNHTIRALSLGGNGGLAIDLGGDGVTPNDTTDADTGPNGLQNFPTAVSAILNGDNTATVSGAFQGAANASFTLRFYRADTGQPPFEGTLTIMTNGSGAATFSAALPFATSAPAANTTLPLVATATDAQGNTSELGGLLTPPPPPQGLRLHTLVPCRFVDTREPEVGPPGAPYGGPALINGRPRIFSVPPAGGPPICSIPTTARALVLNVTVTNSTTGGHVRVSDTPWPADTSTINFDAGQTRANGAVVALGPGGSMAATAFLQGPRSGTVDLILDVSGYLE